MNVAADHSPIINMGNSPRLVRKQGLQLRELLIRQSEMVVYHLKVPTFGSLNQKAALMGILFMGPEPRSPTQQGSE